MKSKLRWIVVLSFCIGSSAMAAAPPPTAQLFAAAFKDVSDSLANVTRDPRFATLSSRRKADALLKGGVRLAAFSLEGLARLYEGYPIEATQELIKTVHKRAKDLENGLGDYDKYKSVGREAKAEEAAVKLEKTLQKEGWVGSGGRSPLLTALQSSLSRVPWLSFEDDRRFALLQLENQVRELRDTKYDMRLLEAGLHELRREIRWFTISVLALDGLLFVTPAAQCPLSQTPFSRWTEKKYAFPTRPRTSSACPISVCVGSEWVGAVKYFGDLKDQAEPIVQNDPELRRKDLTPSRTASEAQRAYRALQQSRLLDRTLEQIRNCH